MLILCGRDIIAIAMEKIFVSVFGVRFLRQSRPPQPNISMMREVRQVKIVGGSWVEAGQFPHQVFLEHGEVFLCGGVILGPLLILTAAHCLTKNIQRNLLRVVAGTNDRALPPGSAPTEQVISARFVHPHENFNSSTLDNDIALIGLSSPLQFNRLVDKVSLPDKRDGISNRTIVTGWGLTEEGFYFSTLLKKVQIPIVSNEVCRDKYKKPGKVITSNMFCAGAEGLDSCQGDSGGPALCSRANPGANSNMVLCGIVSFGLGCGRKDFPGVYTRVANYIDWIEDTERKIRNERNCTPGSRRCNVQLHSAVRHNDLPKMDELIASGVDVNGRNREEKTPLHIVAEISDPIAAVDAAISLIENGADVFARDKNGKTFLHLLLESKKIPPFEFLNMAQFLVNRKLRTLFNSEGGPLKATPLHLAVSKLDMDEQTLPLLHQNQVDFNAVDQNGDNSLAYAVMGGQRISTISKLVELGVKWTGSNSRGENLLHISAKHAHPHAVDFFLRKGLKVNSRDEHGYTALHHLLQSGTGQVLALARFLICSGANPAAKNQWEETPLDIASEREGLPDQEEVLKILK